MSMKQATVGCWNLYLMKFSLQCKYSTNKAPATANSTLVPESALFACIGGAVWKQNLRCDINQNDLSMVFLFQVILLENEEQNRQGSNGVFRIPAKSSTALLEFLISSAT